MVNNQSIDWHSHDDNSYHYFRSTQRDSCIGRCIVACLSVWSRPTTLWRHTTLRRPTMLRWPRGETTYHVATSYHVLTSYHVSTSYHVVTFYYVALRVSTALLRAIWWCSFLCVELDACIRIVAVPEELRGPWGTTLPSSRVSFRLAVSFVHRYRSPKRNDVSRSPMRVGLLGFPVQRHPDANSSWRHESPGYPWPFSQSCRPPTDPSSCSITPTIII
jgi:hypothetical protein